MPPPPADDRPLTWVNAQDKENFILLTPKAVYVATVPAKELPAVDVALEEGEAPDDALKGKFRKIRLSRLTRFQFKSSTSFPNGPVTLYYDDDGTERSAKVALGAADVREDFVKALNARLGWDVSEENESSALVILRYLAVCAAISLGTGALAGMYLAGWITRAPACFAGIINMFGVWGILGAGGLFILLVLIAGVAEAFRPPVVVTYEPDDDEPDDEE